MWYKLVKYFFGKLSAEQQRQFVQEEVDLTNMSAGHRKKAAIELTEAIVASKDSSIDEETAELLISTIIKSVGNRVTAFLVRR